MASAHGTPKTIKGFVVFALLVAVSVAIMFRIPQIRTFVTGGA
jgi:hypothetical protein